MKIAHSYLKGGIEESEKEGFIYLLKNQYQEMGANSQDYCLLMSESSL